MATKEYLVFRERKKKLLIIERKVKKMETPKKLRLHKTGENSSFDLLKISFEEINKKKYFVHFQELHLQDFLWRKSLLNNSIIVKSEQKEKELNYKEFRKEKTKQEKHIKLESLHPKIDNQQNIIKKKKFSDANKGLLKILLVKKSKTLEFNKLNNFTTSTTEDYIPNIDNLNNKFKDSFKFNSVDKKVEKNSFDKINRKKIQQVTLTEMKIFELPKQKETFYI